MDENLGAVAASHRCAGRRDDNDDVPSLHVEEVRRILGDTVGAKSVEPVQTTDYQTSVRAVFLAAWGRATNDPDDQS